MHNLNGYKGLIEYLEARQKAELNIVKDLPINTVIIENSDYDWDEIFSKIINIVS